MTAPVRALSKKATHAIEVAARRAEREKQKHVRFMARTLSIYRNQQARLRKECKQPDAGLPYSLEEFRAFFQAGLDAGCAYTGEVLRLKTAAVDHARPISRGGSWNISNLRVCSAAANFAKGSLEEIEYRQLLCVLEKLPSEAAADVKRRLSAGGRALSMGFRRAA